MSHLLFRFVAASVLVLACKGHALELKVLVHDVDDSLLPDMVVYAEPLQQQAMGKSDRVVEIDQQHKTFAPYISVAQVGNAVRFVNRDDITHHIYSAVGDNKFSFKIRAGKDLIKKDFLTAGEVAMGCNIHDWMSGYLLLLDTPYFGKTDASGEITLLLPEGGRYRVTLWHPQMQEPNHRIASDVDVQENQRLSLRLSKKMAALPKQKNDEDFDFLSDYD